MSKTANPQGMQPPTAQRTAGGEDRQNAQRRYAIQFVVWCIGLIVFLITCVIVHGHRRPYPIDLSITQTVQGWQVPAYINVIFTFPSTLNNPLPSEIALGLWLAFMLIMALLTRLRGKSPLTWLQAVIFLVVTVMSSAGLNVLADDAVGRPRPNPHTDHIKVMGDIVPFPTYPSGHTEHDVAYYGFLLYLSLTRPVREWRYRWLLLPLQIYAVYDILMIGYSRILEGDHWFTDVVGGYLEGAVYLFFFIFLYRWTTTWLARWREERKAKRVATT